MTDPDSPLLPEQEHEVRRLLAAVRHDEPMPAAVVARLDRVLGDLGSARDREATVTALATRRRRVAGLLVAAAAVVVVGIGVGQVVGLGGGAGEDAGSADSAIVDQEAAERDPSSGGVPEDSAQQDGLNADHPAVGPQAEVVRLRERRFSQDVRRAQAFAYDQSTDRKPLTSASALDASCRAAAWGTGRFVPVRYGSEPGVLVLRRPAGGTQVAELFLCGGTQPQRTLSLPAP